MIFVRETTLKKNQWRQILTPKTPIDVTLNRTRMITEISNMKKETVSLLLAPTGPICLNLLNLFLIQTGMKYPDPTEIGKGAWLQREKPRVLPGRVRLFIIFLDRSHNQIPLRTKLKNLWRWDYPLAKVCKRILFCNIFK